MPKIMWFYRCFFKYRPVMRLIQTSFSWSIPAVGSICTMSSSSSKIKKQKEDDNKRQENSKDGINATTYKYYEWKPQHIIAEDELDILKNYACLILNCDIRIPQHIVTRLWQCAGVRCTVDGGTNRWYHFLKSVNKQSANLKPPDLITGDFDSIQEETRKYFSKNGISQFIHTPNQNATDFTKAIDIIRPIILEKQVFHNVIVFHDTSGRFDQIMANINTLFKPQNTVLNIYLLSGTSLTWLLRPGTHSITIPQNLFDHKHWCSLIPIGEKVCNVTTNGLKWNMHNAALYFSGLISTSNTYDSTTVTVQTNGNLIWSMGVYSFVDD